MLRGSVEKEETFSQNFASIGFYLQGRDRSNIKLSGANRGNVINFAGSFAARIDRRCI